MKTITLEEHFVSPGFLVGPGKEFIERIRNMGARGASIVQQLQNIGDERVAEMNAAGIDVQVLSLNSPGIEQASAAEQPGFAAEANDFVAEAVRRHPDRFSALMALPTAAPEKAAAEMERRIGKGFLGSNINGHIGGRYLDDQFFWPILECAEALNVPIYLHPTMPPKAVIDASYSGFSPSVSAVLSNGGWGWHIETATHLIRMILGGVFDRFPKLQIVIGHMGESIPFMLPRLTKSFPKEVTKLERSLVEYLRHNVHYTFGGFNFSATFQILVQEVGVERIMFSVDHPFGSMHEASAFLHKLPISEADRKRIAHGNAEKLFGI